MTKKKILLAIVVGLVITSSFFIYSYFFSAPTELPNDNEMMGQLNEIQTELKVKQVQDKIFLNTSSVYVPFISENDNYGSSYWVWSKRKWRIAHIEENDAPRIWKTDPDDPSSYHFVWNLHPKDKVESLSFYLLKKRYYLLSESVSYYEPQIQLNVTIPSGANSFGTMQIPEEWITTLKEYTKVKSKQSALEQAFSFQWIAKDPHGKSFYPEKSMAEGSSSAWFENEIIDYVMLIDENEIE